MIEDADEDTRRQVWQGPEDPEEMVGVSHWHLRDIFRLWLCYCMAANLEHQHLPVVKDTQVCQLEFKSSPHHLPSVGLWQSHLNSVVSFVK